MVAGFLRTGKPLETIDAEIVVPPPDDLIYKFDGTVHIIESDQIRTRIPVDYDNSIWSGCKIAKGTITGIVIYNGKDSKIMMNSKDTGIKRSLVTEELNTYSKILFVMMLSLSFMILYLKGDYSNVPIQVFRYVLLLSTIIPISMKVNHDISRLFYSSRINHDTDIEGCQARNSDVCEDLGRIEYFLTDKTGTLTKNIMVMRQIFVPGVGLIKEHAFKRQIEQHRKKPDQSFSDFTSCMMVCHSVSPTKNTNSVRVLESSSPDEISFLQLMERDGFFLIDKTDQRVEFKNENGQQETWDILLTFPFTSERKRMGVICRKKGSQELIYFLKGADSIMKDKLEASRRDQMVSYAEDLSSQGLRTLVLAKRIIPDEMYKNWRKDYDAASASLKRRNEKVEASIQQIEQNMSFVGITAVEDLLQDNVKYSIELLREAGIKVWMLTGDKMETAKCISLSTGLLAKNDEIWLIDRVTDGHELRSKFQEYLESYTRNKVYLFNQSLFSC